MVSQSHRRAAACTVAAIIAVDASVRFYWSLGGTWGGEPPLSRPDAIRNAILGLLGLAYAVVLLVRAGYWHEHLPSAVAYVADVPGWLIVIIPLGAALGAFAGSQGPDFLSGLVNAMIALLAFVVVRSEPQPAERARHGPSFR